MRSGALPWQRRAELAVCRGGSGDVATSLRQASAIATVSPMARHLWGRIHATAALAALEEDDAEEAVRSVRAAAGAAVRYGDCPSCSALLNPIAAQAFAELGDADAARGFAEAALGVAGSFDSSAWRAMAESAAASLGAAEGDARRRRKHFETAARLYERAGQPFWTGWARRQAAA
jgi:ATP/maltotriose-dependent transcriptional regulator MalT